MTNKAIMQDYPYILRHDLPTFVQRCFYELCPGTPYMPNWHIDVIAAALEECVSGETRRLIVNVPPRHLKSMLGSVILPAWILGHNPSAQIICMSYGQDLAEKLARDCRQIMTSAWYQAIFPQTRLSKQAINEITTTKSGNRYTTSIGGSVTGRGADYLIIDDPLKPDEAVSNSQRKKVNETFDSTFLSRLNDKRTGRIILIMQRLHLEDLVGHVLAQDSWKHLSFPAIATCDETHTIKTLHGTTTYIRREGEALHPAREPLETLMEMRKTLGEFNFSGQYQQAPIPFGGAIIKDAWILRCRSADIPDKFDQVYQSWDTANKISELSDYSVCTTWGLKGDKLYLLNVFREKIDFPTLKRKILELQDFRKASVVIIEDRASGTQLIQDLRNDGFSQVTAFSPQGDKQMRMHAQSVMFENGFIIVPEDAHWHADYINELTSFPFAKHDDQVDSTSQFLTWYSGRKNFPGSGLFYVMKEQYEEMLRRQKGGK